MLRYLYRALFFNDKWLLAVMPFSFESPVTLFESSASCTAVGIWGKFSVHNLHCA